MHNSLEDFQSLLVFLSATHAGTRDIRRGFEVDLTALTASVEQDNEQVFPFILRRLRSNVEPELMECKYIVSTPFLTKINFYSTVRNTITVNLTISDSEREVQKALEEFTSTINKISFSETLVGDSSRYVLVCFFFFLAHIMGLLYSVFMLHL